MKRINYRLIVSDFDGTLLRSDQTISQYTKDIITDYVRYGGIFVVCTGRMLKSILPNVRALGLSGLVAAYQGAVIADICTGKIIRNFKMTAEQSVTVIKSLEQWDVKFNVYDDDVFYTNMKSDEKSLQLYEKITGVTGKQVDGTLSQYVEKNGLSCQKIACLVDKRERENLYQKLKSQFSEHYDITCSAEVLVEISPKYCDKGEALRYIAEKYSVPLDKTVGIGDNLNDLPMLLKAGLGVAVENAVEQLKENADYVTSGNNQDGVANVIEKYGFEKYD